MEESPHKCPVCNRSFNQRSNLKTHLLTHTDIKPYNCTSCGKVFRRNCDLRRHSLTHNLTSSSTTSTLLTGEIGLGNSSIENNDESHSEASSSGKSSIMSTVTPIRALTKLPSINATILSIKANSKKRAYDEN